MIEILRLSGIYIPPQYQNKSWVKQIKNFYHRTHKNFNNDDLTEIDYFVELQNGAILIPRFAPIQKYISEEYIIRDKLTPGKKIKIEHNIAPRNKIQEDAMLKFLQYDNGLFVLAPGEGKTVISIYAIAERAVKTLIITHKNSLCDQWKERILEFTNLSDDQVRLVSSSTYKIDFWEPICIITNQTFNSLLQRDNKFTSILRDANFGICISDECHTSVGAPSFSKSAIWTPAQCFYGLSATPNRMNDSDVIRHHLGNEFVFSSSKDTLKGKVTIIAYDFQIESNHKKYLHFNGKFQRARYLNFLDRADDLNTFILGLIRRINNENRNCIVVSERLKHIEKLKNSLGLEYDVGCFTAETSNEELRRKITFSTPGKIRDGVDAPWKDTLILTSPISNIQQMVGRIVRTYENKQYPLVLDIVDIGSPDIKRTVTRRIEFYEKENWEVQYVLIKNKTKCIKMNKNEFFKQIIMA